jgi:hypothetical protein
MDPRPERYSTPQFDAVASRNDWTSSEKVTHLLAVLQGQATDILHIVPDGASYEDIVEGSEGQLGKPPAGSNLQGAT